MTEQTDKPQPNPLEEKPVQLSKGQRMQAMLDLSDKFGGSADIPELDLTAIGYVRRTMTDGTIRLLPRERYDELAKKDKDWEKPLRERERPFDRIPVVLSTTELAFRFMPADQSTVFKDRLVAVEQAFDDPWETLGEESDPNRPWQGEGILDSRMQNLRTFYLSFSDFISKEVSESGGNIDDIGRESWFFDSLPKLSVATYGKPEAFDDPNYFTVSKFLASHTEAGGTYAPINDTEAEKMYNELARLSGFYADVPELRRDFRNRLADIIVDQGSIKLWSKADKEEADFLKPYGVKTYADFIKTFLPKYLEQAGLSEMAAVVNAGALLDQIADLLRSTPIKDPTLGEEKDLRKSLKSASPEERNILSKRLKDLETEKKVRKQIREGVIDYFASPEVYAEICRRKIKEAQDFLVSGKSKATEQTTVYLDATDNPELDKDPGEVSGDCTAGKPLPFDRPNIPAYNVKVFRGKDNHIGNMYLLVTKENAEERHKVWHFDAIQIPYSTIDWSKSIPVIVKALSEAAKAKGINVITSNKEKFHISNYDFIQDAVLRYWETNQGRETDVDIPKIDEEGYSNFQGDGEALILWEKETSSEDPR